MSKIFYYYLFCLWLGLLYLCLQKKNNTKIETMRILLTLLIACSCISLSAQTDCYRFDFTGKKKSKEGYIQVTPDMHYNTGACYGYDYTAPQASVSGGPFHFSVKVPDGNYRVSIVVGSHRTAAITTLRGESRRLFYEQIHTKKGELKTCTFTINKRSTLINGDEHVRIKRREQGKLNWDEKLTIEVTGPAPQIAEMTIERIDTAITVFLCGNSTVVDQDNEPWASWGQMIPRFFDEEVCFANYAESGETAASFIAAGRLKKLLTQIKKGDYVIVEFGHNDQKLTGVGDGAFYSFMTNMKIFVDEARRRGATPILVTPTQRRSFNKEGKIADTHLDFPEATRFLCQREGVHLIDLHAMTRTLYEAMGPEASKGAFVHYPAGSYPGQDKPLADNTHFNPYGAYQISKCVIEGIRELNLDLMLHLRPDYTSYDPALPDDRNAFVWDESRFVEIEKPDGN